MWRSAWLLWLPMLLLAVVLVGSIANGETTDDGRWIGLSAVHVFFVGLLEELPARGVVLFLLLYAWREREHGVLEAALVLRTNTLCYGLVLVRRREPPATAQSWSGGGGG